MNKLLCKIFGHRWHYYLGGSNSAMQKTEIRVCFRCKKVQRWYILPLMWGKEEFWADMLKRTKAGAKKYHKALKTSQN